jgi:O-antigen ligase
MANDLLGDEAGADGRHEWADARVAGPWRRLATADGLVASALVALAFWNRPLGRIEGINLRPDWTASVLALAWAVHAVARRRPLLPVPVLASLGGFAGVQLLSSALNAAAWPAGLKFSLLYVLGLAYAVAVFTATARETMARWALTLVIGLGLAEALFGMISVLLLNVRGVSLGGASLNSIGVAAARGTMSERNLFSSLLLVPYALALWRWGPMPRRSWPIALAVTGMTAGISFGLTRAVWVAAAGIVVVWWWRVRPGRAKLLAVTLAGILGALTLTTSELLAVERAQMQMGLYDRLLRYSVQGSDPPAATRLEEVHTSAAGWRKAPWLGHGAGSVIGLEQFVGEMARLKKRRHAWVGNVCFMILHDAGLVGLMMFGGVVVTVAWDVWRTARLARNDGLQAEREAIAAGLVAVLLAWQTTNGLWLMYGYAFTGLLLSLNALARGRPA